MGLHEYGGTFAAMKRFTDGRDAETADEIWLLEHAPVYTLGLAAGNEHILDAGKIPVVKTDRGGQVTYHGPGQLVVYVLIDLRRRGVSIKSLVHHLEQAGIDLLSEFGIAGRRRGGAPGVYVSESKIAAVGLRVRRGCSYHGLALNVDGDLHPFNGINPCGYPGLRVTRLANLGVEISTAQAGARLVPHILRRLGYREIEVSVRGLTDVQSRCAAVV